MEFPWDGQHAMEKKFQRAEDRLRNQEIPLTRSEIDTISFPEPAILGKEREALG
jgi:hypothetical protein